MCSSVDTTNPFEVEWMNKQSLNVKNEFDIVALDDNYIHIFECKTTDFRKKSAINTLYKLSASPLLSVHSLFTDSIMSVTGQNQMDGWHANSKQVILHSTRNIKFGSVSNGEVMRIDNANGRVGIGYSSPATKLHV